MRKILLFFLLVIVLLGVSSLFYIYAGLKPVSSDTKVKVFVVNDGDKIETITNNLEKNNLIRDKFAFIAYILYTGDGKKLKSGNYRLSSSMSSQEIVAKLIKGGSHDYWLKVKDGSRIEEIATLFPENLYFTPKDFINKSKAIEGYLFPDSYLIPEYFDVDQVLGVINNNFAQKISQAKENATNNKMSDNQIVILASLLEREGNTLESKKMIAGIIFNRLEIGMPLQLDATVQYARDSKTSPKNYWLPVSSHDLDLVSPYNTYINKGMPPKPICNPGFNSLLAAYHPTPSDYLFYITGNDGITYYAKTLDEHNLNIKKYLR